MVDRRGSESNLKVLYVLNLFLADNLIINKTKLNPNKLIQNQNEFIRNKFCLVYVLKEGKFFMKTKQQK